MFTLKIRIRNAAFYSGDEKEPAAEVARILQEVAEELETYLIGATTADGELLDINGNTVGEWKLTNR